MQTFLPSQSYQESAQYLDNRRLNKQITEVWQILQSLRNPVYGWKNHPAVAMWKGCEDELIRYGLHCYAEWQQRLDDGLRGGKRDHKSGEALWGEFYSSGNPVDIPYDDESDSPPWLTEEFCSNHRSILLGKNYEWYSQFEWDEEPAEMVDGKWPYLWGIA